MPSKKITEKTVRQPSINSAREKKQYRAIVIGFIITAVLIVGFAGYAILYEAFLKNRIPVANVNELSIDNAYFQDRVRLERNSYIQQFNIIYAQYQLLSDDPDSAEYYQSQLAQVQQILDSTESFAKTVLDKIVDEEIVVQKASELGLEVTDTEVEEAIQGIFQFYPDGTPTPAPTSPAYTTPTPSQAQLELLSYTPTPLSPVPEITEENTETATKDSVETDVLITPQVEEQLTIEAESTPTIAPTSTLAPTATVYTKELYQEAYQGYINDLSGINVSESSLRTYMRNYLLIQKVRDEVIKDIIREQEQVWARHILVQSQAEALIVLDRLNKGEDWAAIAADVSLDTSNKDFGGDLGWFPRGQMVEAFENAAFNLEPGEISEPVESDFGWHIIQLVGKETLPLSDSELESVQEIEYQKWFQEARESAEITLNEVWKDLAPGDPTIPQEYRVF